MSKRPPTLSQVAAFYRGFRVCRDCGTPLKEGVNTYASWIKACHYSCIPCRTLYTRAHREKLRLKERRAKARRERAQAIIKSLYSVEPFPMAEPVILPMPCPPPEYTPRLWWKALWRRVTG